MESLLNRIVKYKVSNTYICTIDNKVHFLSASDRSSNINKSIKIQIQQPQITCKETVKVIIARVFDTETFPTHRQFSRYNKKISWCQNDWRIAFLLPSLVNSFNTHILNIYRPANRINEQLEWWLFQIPTAWSIKSYVIRRTIEFEVKSNLTQ